MMKKMKSKLLNIFNDGFRQGQYLRLKENSLLKIYIGKDQKGRFSFEFRGVFIPTKLLSSAVINVSQTKQDGCLSLCFSLENADLLEYFCTFCEDLISSTNSISDDNIAYRILSSRYLSWKKLFKPNQGKLSENDVMGLIGELLFLKNIMFNKYGYDLSLESWTGPELTHKDFSLEETWYEIKSISVGKGTTKISSIEQLDSDVNGFLIVIELEKMSPSFNGLKLNSLVTEILVTLPHNIQKEFFLSKLNQYGYDFSPEYDNFVFSCIKQEAYVVDASFPRLTRIQVPTAVQKVQYELILAEIESFKKSL